MRKFRSQIQEKAFIKDTTVAEDLQKEDANKTSSTNALRVNETQVSCHKLTLKFLSKHC